MIRLTSVLFASGLLVCSMAMWEPIGPYAGKIVCIEQSPTNASMLYAVLDGYSGQAFSSSDGGQNWVRRDEIQGYVRDLYCGDGNALLASGNGFIKRSTDNGDTWIQVYNGSAQINQMVPHPTSDQVIFAVGTSYDSRAVFLKSVNNGISWESSVVSTQESEGLSIGVSQQNSDIIYIAGSAGNFSSQQPALFISQNGGSSFYPVACSGIPTGETEIISISVSPSNGSVLIAGTGESVLRSTNGGSSWSVRVNGLNWGESVVYSPVNPDIAYAIESQSIHVSANGGLNWTERAAGDSGNHCEEVFPDRFNGSTVLIGNSMGVHSSTNSGSSWEFIVNGINGGEGTAVAVSPSNPSIIWAQLEDHGFFKSTNGGDTWTQSGPWPFTCNDFSSIAIHPTNPSIIYTFESDG